MTNYYQIIDGKRYDASLLRNAEFRTRGQGDGRISLQDAQDLWKIAMDGGRITETEEDTLEYILKTFNWTDPAEKWMREELAKEAVQVNSYYKVIDGLRYDRKVLQEADAKVAGQGDGRISKADAEFLLPLFGDFGDVTIIEERTLTYLLENYNWTEAAKDWFMERVSRISKQSSVEAALRAIMRSEYHFRQLGFAYFKEEAVQQMLDFENETSLPDALRKAIDNLLNYQEDGSYYTSRGFVSTSEAKEFLEGGRLVLLPGDIASEPSLPSFPSPLRGESLQENWIFGLELFDLTDDIYWVIVPRRGSGEVYNYIGGANVEDEWPRPTGEKYWSVVVKSCAEPYPGISVTVRKPNGDYYTGKSDAEGKVKITGPAGEYDIYASDGWSQQSKRFQWDGEGIDQEKAVVLDC